MIDQKLVQQELDRMGNVRFSVFDDLEFLPEKIYDHLDICLKLLNRFSNAFRQLKDGDPNVKPLIVKLERTLKEAKITTDKIDDLM